MGFILETVVDLTEDVKMSDEDFLVQELENTTITPRDTIDDLCSNFCSSVKLEQPEVQFPKENLDRIDIIYGNTPDHVILCNSRNSYMRCHFNDPDFALSDRFVFNNVIGMKKLNKTSLMLYLQFEEHN